MNTINTPNKPLQKFAVYRQVIGTHREYHSYIGNVMAIDRNDACLKFRQGEYKDDFLTARKIVST